MEVLVNDAFWRGRRVFLTGHTGFKGSWLALWLSEMGADVTGFALPADEPSLFRQAEIEARVTHIEGDIRDMAVLEAAMSRCDPEVVFHLAAQPLVRHSYAFPVDTYATNVMGTVHLLDACRRMPSLRSVVCITTDKCYENREWVWPYRENDPMGGHDPYSSSKGAAELVAAAYRNSFFGGDRAIATVRAGNVIGGGDWAADRLIPDIVRALIANREVVIRSPKAVRPWQHVLEALNGYLLIAQRLASGDQTVATAWNFGPDDSDTRPVDWILERLIASWGEGQWRLDSDAGPHEAMQLRLDCSKARSELGWRPVLGLINALDWIVEWHKKVASGESARSISLGQLDRFRALASTSLATMGITE